MKILAPGVQSISFMPLAFLIVINTSQTVESGGAVESPRREMLLVSVAAVVGAGVATLVTLVVLDVEVVGAAKIAGSCSPNKIQHDHSILHTTRAIVSYFNSFVW